MTSTVRSLQENLKPQPGCIGLAIAGNPKTRNPESRIQNPKSGIRNSEKGKA